MTPDERFDAKVEKTATCWFWTGCVTHNDYGQFRVSAAPVQRRVPAHRYSYERWVGPIPEGLVIDHLCRVTNCVNPAHLEAVTQRENILRGKAPNAENAAKTHCLRGHPLTAGNLRPHGARHGKRKCRTCHNILNRARRAARLEALNAE